jgi:hypothetical protein
VDREGVPLGLDVREVGVFVLHSPQLVLWFWGLGGPGFKGGLKAWALCGEVVMPSRLRRV